MKKTAVFLILLLMISTSAFAVQLGTTQQLEVAASNDVTITYGADTTNNGATFSIVTYHAKGTRAYMSSSEDAVIYWGSYSPGDTPAAPTAPTVGTSVGPTSTYDGTL